jgi:hypothetical protein
MGKTPKDECVKLVESMPRSAKGQKWLYKILKKEIF